MNGERSPVTSHRLPSLSEKFRDKQYRDSYVASHARRVLAEQMRNFRGHLSQADYAAKLDKQKTVVGRLENPAYGGWSVRTMLEIARKENVAVFVRFVDFPTFLKYTDDLSDGALLPRSYNQDAIDELAKADECAAGESALKALFEREPDQAHGQSAIQPASPRRDNQILPTPANDQIPVPLKCDAQISNSASSR
jgi:hypothetical protein